LDSIESSTLFGVLSLLILLSAFFSSSETSLMALNRYRLKHLAHKNHRGAKRIMRLLERPDQLLSVILIGNNLVNTFLTIIATILTQRYFGNTGVIWVGLAVTLVILIFGEVTPKTLAALRPETVAYPVSFILSPLIKVTYPFAWFINAFSNALLRMLRVNPVSQKEDHLTHDELRSLVHESGGLITPRYRSMLLNILDLDEITIEDIMIPRGDIVGLDISKDLETLLTEVSESGFTRLPVYNEDINNIVGILHVKQLLQFMKSGEMPEDKSCITENMQPPYFVPESTPLNIQLINFQKDKHRIAIVVDEYGDVQGIVTLEDILEEIVGEFTTHVEDDIDEVKRQTDGSVTIDCSATIRDINRTLHWQLPTDGPKTLNGLITEKLGTIPDNALCFEIGTYCFETTEIGDNRVKTVKAFERSKTLPLFG
jgi:Mg2+/Co2+ transporter CorB